MHCLFITKVDMLRENIAVDNNTLCGQNVNISIINPLNAELNPICHLLALVGGATIVVVSRLRVKVTEWR